MNDQAIGYDLLLVEPYEIVRVMRNTLSFIDKRLVQHGERVAYIAMSILRYGGLHRAIDPDRMQVLALLHDIGAYKTDEIDTMVSFEINDVYEHAIYGYLFLRYLAPTGEAAEAVLYHHTAYEKLRDVRSRYRDDAMLIHLADRIDILLQHGMKDPAALIMAQAGTQFDPEMAAAFVRADAARDICGAIRSGAYLPAVDQAIREMKLLPEEAFGYLQMLVYAIDFRSEATVTHTVMTAVLSEELGHLFGLDETTLKKLCSGGFLHDVGKIGTPVAILENPGRLTDEEMALMRMHVVLTEEIIRDVVEDDICDIAVRHHEKLDGSGYPYGLRGEDLTLPQRILAVADVISALSGRRSYKEPMRADEVCGILRSMQAKGKLCPAVCGMAVSHYEEIMGNAVQRSMPAMELYRSLMARYAELMQDPLFHKA